MRISRPAAGSEQVAACERPGFVRDACATDASKGTAMDADDYVAVAEGYWERVADLAFPNDPPCMRSNEPLRIISANPFVSLAIA